ncbi:hypothetical protein A3L12_02795 [Thermococcus sp. P6]|uniref:hypothetical protein n=1 Tax=Thermococcus sp. P6 TaxID=122420 RepID=UPI000B59FF44|nr:hypothetical protein [Thermococcus sp. P6]ASJ10298.1 hypothetical protein A3L12_02795 [Thermococcus sp. P6]
MSFEFIKLYLEWLRKTPNEIWSRRQAEFINALLENAVNFPLSKEEYLRIKERARKLKGGKRI